MTSFLRSQSGMSLVELMVSLVAGLIVAGAAVAFTVSSLRSNTEYITATRLTQELRTSMNFVVDELQRAGYDENALDYIAQPVATATSSAFSLIQIADSDGDGVNDCVIYAYDRLPANPGQVDLSNGEIRAIRRTVVPGTDVGVLEFAESAAGLTPSCNGNAADYSTYPPTCNAGSGWCAVSDPRVLDIQRLAFTDASVGVPGNLSIGISNLLIRRVGVEMIGRLQGVPDTQIRRGLRSDIRVRADCIRANLNDCRASPSGV